MNNTWYSKKIFSFFILAAISIILIFSASKIEIGESNDSRYTIYSIIFEYYGMDSRQIENQITIPIEEEIMSLSDLIELRSTVEYGKSTTTAYFKKNVDTKTTYLNIRNLVQNIYETLPQDVQRPRIISSASDSKAVLCISFSGASVSGNMRNWIEQNLKKDFESIDGVSEVIISGGKIEEIEIAFDPLKIVSAGQNPMQLSQIVQDGNTTIPGAVLKTKIKNENIKFKTKLETLDQIKKLPIKTDESYSTLGYFSEITKTGRINNEIVRINGNECITLSILSSSNGNNIKISKAARELLNNRNDISQTWTILYDNGADIEKNIHKVFIALLESFFFIIIIIPFFFNSRKSLFLTIIFLSLSCIWTLGFLQLLNFTINQNTLSGMTIAIGLIADSFFIINETAFSASFENSFFEKLLKLIPSAISASLTTVITLIPLYFCDSIVPGIKTISITIGIMILVSTFLSLVFYPCFIYSTSLFEKKIIPDFLFNKTKRFYTRKTLKASLLSVKHYKFSRFLYFLILIIPFFIFLLIGKNINLENQNNVIYSSVEFESDNHINYVDSEIAPLIKQISNLKEVRFVKSEARKGSAQLEIGYDEKLTDKVSLSSKIASFKKTVSTGFLYVPQNTHKKKKPKIIEIAVIGDEVELCKKYAHDAVKLLSNNVQYENIVLNFKENESVFEFIPSKELLIKNNLSVQNVSSILRWIMFGPVADKWQEDGQEMDIRIRGKNYTTPPLSDVKNLYIPSEYTNLRLESLGKIEKKSSNGKIYRKDSRHAAYFTVEASFAGTDRIVKELKSELSSIPLKKGYAFSFSRDIELLSKQYSLLFFSLAVSIIAVLLLLTALTENIKKSLLLISIIPVSFFIPLLIKLVSGLNLELGDITGMVLLSGLSVNNTIYILESKNRSVVLKIRNKISSILVTSLTSIVSAVPLLILSKESFSKSLSFFMVWGILCSCAVCFVLFPGCFPKEKK